MERSAVLKNLVNLNITSPSRILRVLTGDAGGLKKVCTIESAIGLALSADCELATLTEVLYPRSAVPDYSNPPFLTSSEQKVSPHVSLLSCECRTAVGGRDSNCLSDPET